MKDELMPCVRPNIHGDLMGPKLPMNFESHPRYMTIHPRNCGEGDKDTFAGWGHRG